MRCPTARKCDNDGRSRLSITFEIETFQKAGPTSFQMCRHDSKAFDKKAEIEGKVYFELHLENSKWNFRKLQNV